MPESDRTSAAARPHLDRDEPYWRASTRPLASLVFLLPLIVAYEAGSFIQLSDPERHAIGSIKAERLLHSIFEIFGVVGLALPAILLVTVLLVWHVLENRPWRVRGTVIARMAVESLAWTLPLFVLAGLASLLGSSTSQLAAQDGGDSFQGLSMGWRLWIAVGAGLYEEFLFRMIGVALVHSLMVDLFGVKERLGRVVAVGVTAGAFAWYHAPAEVWLFVYYAMAGAFFGVLYLGRGFGITAGAHAFFDILVLVVLKGQDF
jgi:heme/copper-type cytochrome/quinol oxidase subunit 2